jgi:large subunit ribosomal protein L9
MKVLLIKDVYKLGRAGEVRRVADGYGRNYLLPQGLAVLATPGALKQAEFIKNQAETQRQALNQELGSVAERIQGLVLTFPARASETGKLYGSISSQMIAEALSQRTGVEISRRQMEIEPLRSLGEYQIPIRLTVDLIPEVTVIVHREGESPALPQVGPQAEEVEQGGTGLEEREEQELTELEEQLANIESEEGNPAAPPEP